MKRFYLMVNSILVIIILGIVFMIPESRNARATSSILSKSLTTSLIGTTLEEKQVDRNSMNEVISNFTSSINSNITEPKLITDVLETIYGTMSGYGLDCKGCSGVVGARYDAKGNNLRYYDKTYGECRIVAGDRKYPYGTIVRVKNSKIGTFNAIVLDRGSAIVGLTMDLLYPSEADTVIVGRQRNIEFEVLRWGWK